jgi:hypothetical protein
MASREEKIKQSAKLSQQLLREHGISYTAKVYHSDRSSRVPAHVIRLSKILLDFESLICETDKDLFDEDLFSKLLESHPDAIYPVPRRQFVRKKEIEIEESKRREMIENCCKGAEKAESFLDRGFKEDHWQRHIERYFFTEFEEHSVLDPILPGYSVLVQI